MRSVQQRLAGRALSLRAIEPHLLVQRRFENNAAAASLSAFETVIGLELHVQVQTRTKLFSGSSAGFGVDPNTNVAPFDVAMPGSLPSLNRTVVEAAVRLGFALGATINKRSTFDRKHYFYHDLPHGFQITQQRNPIVTGGAVELVAADSEASPDAFPPRTVRIERVQIEMDTGKTVHGAREPGVLMVDYNRAGCALLEIVSSPDMRSGEEAAAYVRKVQRILRHIGVSTANMEEGSLRCDVNVSVRERAGEGRVGSRVEIKNLNSTRSIARAVDYEAKRHAALLTAGEAVRRQTLGFDVPSGKTAVLRSKEVALDYRFIPEPDLPPLARHSIPARSRPFRHWPRISPVLAAVLDDALIAALQESTPELPEQAERRITETLGVPPQITRLIVQRPEILAFFQATLAALRKDIGDKTDAAVVARWVVGELIGAAREAASSSREAGSAIAGLPRSVSPERLAQLLTLVLGSRTISERMAKDVLDTMLRGDARAVAEIAKEVCGGGMVSDDATLRALCAEIVGRSPQEAQLNRGGRKKLMGYFVGELMKATKGRADGQKATPYFLELIAAGAGGDDGVAGAPGGEATGAGRGEEPPLSPDGGGAGGKKVKRRPLEDGAEDGGGSGGGAGTSGG